MGRALRWLAGVVGVGAALGLVLVGLGCSESQNASPDNKSSSGLVVPGSPEFDFHEHRQGEVLNHTFSLLNKSSIPLKIVELKTSCTCLVAGVGETPGSTTIAPGKRFSLPVHFTTRGAQETASGRIIVGYCKANAPADSGPQAFVSLRVRADVIPDFRIVPRDVDFGVVNGLDSQQVSRTIRLVPAAVDKIEVRMLTTSSSFLSAAVLPRKPNDSGTQIKIQLDLSAFTRSRSVRGSVIVSTNSERHPQALVRVHAKYDAPATAKPGMIVIGSDQRGEVRKELRMTTSLPARIQRVRCSPERGVRVKFNGTQTERTHLMLLFVKPCRDKALNCELVVEFRLFAAGGKSIVRTLRVPVHRFLEKGIANAKP